MFGHPPVYKLGKRQGLGARNQQNVKSYFSSYHQHFCLIINNIIFSYLSRDNMINYLLILIFCLNYKLEYFGEMSFNDLNTGFFSLLPF